MSKTVEIIVAIILIASVFVGPVSASQNSSEQTSSASDIYPYEDYAPFESATQGYDYYLSDGYSEESTRGGDFYQRDLDQYGNYNKVSEGYQFFEQDYEDYPLDEDFYEYDERW